MNKSLQDIGFYTLSDDRAKNSSSTSPMWRCELIVTDKCNFNCTYCRGLNKNISSEMSYSDAIFVLSLWCADNLKNVRFSGGEPTLYEHLDSLCRYCVSKKVQRIAISTNGSSSHNVYENLMLCGANDFSISLDACCSSFANKMAGCECTFDKVCENIMFLSSRVYTTVGVVINEQNIDELQKIILFADSLGVSDIRIIPAAQYNDKLSSINIPKTILEKHPILKYRINNAKDSISTRGINKEDPKRCFLVCDDSAVAGKYHFPCIIYLREFGEPIGKVGPLMRSERIRWSNIHNVHNDPICKVNCLDVCVEYNRKVRDFRETKEYGSYQ